MMAAVLSPKESTRLEKCEAVIERGLQTFVEVGNALLEIRNSRLYRQEFDTFEDYCRERWQMSYRRAAQLMDAAEIVSNLNNCSETPTHESQVRPLTKLEPEEQREAWNEAVKDSPNGKPTAKDVEAAVDRFKAPVKSDDPPKVDSWARPDQGNLGDQDTEQDEQSDSEEAARLANLKAKVEKLASPLFKPLIAIIERYPATQQYEVWGILLDLWWEGLDRLKIWDDWRDVTKMSLDEWKNDVRIKLSRQPVFCQRFKILDRSIGDVAQAKLSDKKDRLKWLVAEARRHFINLTFTVEDDALRWDAKERRPGFRVGKDGTHYMLFPK